MTLTPEQLEQRKAGIGSSDIAAVVGLNPYRGPHDVWAEKLGISEPFEGNAYTEFGNRLEPVLLQYWGERFRDRYDWVPGNETVSHPDAPWMMATPDGIGWLADHSNEDPSIIIEAKTADWRQADRWGEEGTDDVPEEYLCQVAWQMAVLNVDRADIVALVGREFRIYHIHRNMEFERKLIATARDFWFNHVVDEVAPPVDSSDACIANLAWRNKGGEYLEDDCRAELLMLKISNARQAKELWENEEKKNRAELMELIGDDHKGFRCDIGSIFWVERKPSYKTDWEALARAKGVTQEEIDNASRLTGGSKYPQVRFKKEKEA